MRLQVRITSEAHDTPHDFLIFSNADMILVASISVIQVNLFIRASVVDCVSDRHSDTRLFECVVLLVFVGVLAHFLQPFLSVGLATNKVHTEFVKQTNYTTYLFPVLVINIKQTMSLIDENHIVTETNKQRKPWDPELLIQIKQTKKARLDWYIN